MPVSSGLSGVRISGIGYELGDKLILNEDISAMVEASVKAKLGKSELSDKEKDSNLTSHEWIVPKTGIEQRYFAGQEVATSDLAARAARKAILKSGRKLDECEFIIIATVTPDYPYSPPTSPLIQNKIGRSVASEWGLKECFTVDVSSACTSFIAALRLGCSLIASGQFKFGVVVGADKMSTTVDFSDRNFCVLLGDAAAAITLQADLGAGETFYLRSNSFFSWCDGSKGENIIAKIGGSAKPITRELLDGKDDSKDRPPISEFKLWQDGHSVFKDMSRLIFSAEKPERTVMGRALAKAGVSLASIDIVFFHQANLRIIKIVEDKMLEAGFNGIIFNTISRFGNTTSASVPLGMAVAHEEGILKKGQLVLACAFGGGYTAGTAIFNWTI